VQLLVVTVMLDIDTEDGCVWDRTCMSIVLARHAGRVTFLNITEELHSMKNGKLEGDQLLCGICGSLMALLKTSNQIVSSQYCDQHCVVECCQIPSLIAVLLSNEISPCY
jgi:hypothetical protein